jgi:hypothetical protein
MNATCAKPKTYKLVLYSLDTLAKAGEYAFTPADGTPVKLTAGGWVEVITTGPDQVVSIDVADAANPTLINPHVIPNGRAPITPTPLTVDLEDVMPNAPSNILDPGYAAIGHLGSVALHQWTDGAAKYTIHFSAVSFLSASASTASVGVIGDILAMPGSTFTTTGKAAIATTGLPTNNGLLYVDFFAQQVIGSASLAGMGIGTPRSVTAADVADTAWLSSNDLTNNIGYISAWGLGTAVKQASFAQLPGPAADIDGAQAFNGQCIAVTVSGSSPQVLWFDGTTNLGPQTPPVASFVGSPQQLRVSMAGSNGGPCGSLTWVATNSPPAILGYVTMVPSTPPRTIDLSSEGTPIDFVVAAPDVNSGSTSGGTNGFVHVLVAN